MCQQSNKIWKMPNETKEVSWVLEGLTRHRGGQSAGAIRIRVGGSIGLVVGGLLSKGEMRTCQWPIKKLKAPKKKGITLAQGGLTGHWGDQSAGAIRIRVSGSVGLVVGGLWSKGEMRTCQQPIKKLKAPKKKGVTLALRGLTRRLWGQSADAIRVQVGGSVGLVVGGLWA